MKDAKKRMCFSPVFRVTAVFVKRKILASTAEDMRGASLRCSFSFDGSLLLLKSVPIDAEWMQLSSGPHSFRVYVRYLNSQREMLSSRNRMHILQPTNMSTHQSWETCTIQRMVDVKGAIERYYHELVRGVLGFNQIPQKYVLRALKGTSFS